MSRIFLSIVGIAVLASAAATAVSGCAGVFDRIADTLLANEVRFDDRETPRTAYAIPASADALQTLGGQGGGLSCSLPPGTQALAFRRGARQAPIALQMRQACAFHDYCYRHGNATYGYSQADCDLMLQQQAFRLCKYINPEHSIDSCETNARKVTLGVRLGGFGSFKRARALEDEKASTFLEFDPYPVRANSYRVVRIADAPQQWRRDGLLPKAVYHFDIRPSGSQVYVLGWKPGGGMVCASFELPGAYDVLNGPPMVVRAGAGGEDWFVWWKREALSSTRGRFALLPPGRATRQDWNLAAGGWVRDEEALGCESRALWSLEDNVARPAQLAFVSEKKNLGFSELHPVVGGTGSGVLQLMGLSTHSCDGAKTDLSPCLVEVTFDTVQRAFRQQPKSPTLYRASERNCGGGQSGDRRNDDCSRYRNYVSAPFVVAWTSPPSLLWIRRGSGNGDGYEHTATLRRYTVGKTRADPAIDLGDRLLTAFPETMEPAFITNAAADALSFVSLVAAGEGIQLYSQAAVARGKASTAVRLECLRNAPVSWLQRPTFLAQDPLDASRSYLVFSRVRLLDGQGVAPAQGALLEIAVATLANDACLGVREFAYPSFFDGFAERDEQEASVAMATATAQGNQPDNSQQEAFERYAERVRGGQMLLADVTGDGVLDLLQVAQLPQQRRFRVGLLAGDIDASGLHFQRIFRTGP